MPYKHGTKTHGGKLISGIPIVLAAVSRIPPRAVEVQGPEAVPLRAEQRPGLLFIDRDRTKNGC